MVGLSLYGSSSAAPREPSAPSAYSFTLRIQSVLSYPATSGPRANHFAIVAESSEIIA